MNIAVLDRWKNARLQLAQAAQSFLDASVQLQSTAVQEPLSRGRSDILNDLAQAIQDELVVDDFIEAKIAKSRAMTNRTRNMSTTMVPINVLPLELLSRVFLYTLPSRNCWPNPGKKDQVLVISSTCSQWRRVAVTTRYLWSHINLYPRGLLSHRNGQLPGAADVWVERARGAPLHLHILPAQNMGIHRYLYERLAALRPHLNFLSSLEIQRPVSDTVREAFAAISHDITPGVFDSLIISGFDYYSFVEDRLIWPAGYLQGLVNLQLSALRSDCCPSLDELTTILAGSERLQTLRLRDMHLIAGTVAAIHLPNLNLLDVVGTDSENLTILLSAITLGNTELDLRIDLGTFSADAAIDQLIQFTTRSNVVSLFVESSNLPPNQDVEPSNFLPAQDLQRLFASMPSLRVLVHKDLTNCFRLLDHLVALEYGRSQTERLKLHTLCLCGQGAFEDGADLRLEMVVTLYLLHRVVLDNCGFTPLWKSDSEYSDTDISQPEPWETEILERLAGRVQSVRITDRVLDGYRRTGYGQTRDEALYERHEDSHMECVDLYMQQLIHDSKYDTG